MPALANITYTMVNTQFLPSSNEIYSNYIILSTETFCSFRDTGKVVRRALLNEFRVFVVVVISRWNIQESVKSM